MPHLLRALAPFDDDEPDSSADASRLLQFNADLIGQALGVVDAHECAGAPPFSEHAGPHLRHVIEHYEALLLRPTHGVIDYDNRPRDRELERCTLRARARLLRLRARLHGERAVDLEAPVHVVTRCGLVGEYELRSRSSIGRELMFLAGHAVHHFALLKLVCTQRGLTLDPHFGKAPATLHHERRA